ncbi:MAG: 4Fe-4S dicluster domain-containing protein [bacterium]
MVTAEAGSNILSCYQCGKCSAGCSVSEVTDLLPHRIIRLAQLGMRKEILQAKHIWICTGCGTCSTRCPNEVDVAGVMDRMKALAMRSGETTEAEDAAKFHQLFLASIAKFGRAHEFGVLRRLKGMGGMMKDMGLGLKLMRKGKIKLRASKIVGRDEIRALYQAAQESEK